MDRLIVSEWVPVNQFDTFIGRHVCTLETAINGWSSGSQSHNNLIFSNWRWSASQPFSSWLWWLVWLMHCSTDISQVFLWSNRRLIDIRSVVMVLDMELLCFSKQRIRSLRLDPWWEVWCSRSDHVYQFNRYKQRVSSKFLSRCRPVEWILWLDNLWNDFTCLLSNPWTRLVCF